MMMFPFGLVACFVNGKETRITEFTEAGFLVRMHREVPEINSVKVYFYQMEKASYREIELRDFEAEITSGREDEGSLPDEFFTEYEISTSQKDYGEALQRLMGEYSRYIRLKLEEDDGKLAETLTGYPAEKDEEHFSSLEAQKRSWFGIGQIGKAPAMKKSGRDCGNIFKDINPEYALTLDRQELYRMYLANPIQDFVRLYEQKNGLPFPELKGKVPDRLYIGNQFCHLLFPEEEQLFSLMEKAWEEHVEITLAFSYVRQDLLANVEKLLGKVDKWCRDHTAGVEITVNDWAVASIIKEKCPRLISNLGILLNKRKKDPRMKWKTGDSVFFQENNLNSDFYREFLEQELGISRYEWESLGCALKFPPGKNSLHIPFYQTNTSQYCPLYAVLVNGQRGKQGYIKECPGYCTDKALLYPGHLNMVGRYNSLFALDETILKNPETRISKDVDRIVVNML